MLDVCSSSGVIDDIWNSLSPQAMLPCSAQEYWSKSGPTRTQNDSRRCHHRFYLRGMGIARSDQGLLAIYLKDVSRMGVGFYSPVQLFPCDEVELHVTGDRLLQINITRCIRLGKHCFDCGSTYSRRGLVAVPHFKE